MTISFYCQCGRRITVEDQHGGKTGRCANCNSLLRIPLAVETETLANRNTFGVVWASSWMSSFLVHVLLLIFMTFILFNPLAQEDRESIWCRTDTVEGLLDDLTISDPELFDEEQFYVELKPLIHVTSVAEDLTQVTSDPSVKTNDATPQKTEDVELFDASSRDAPTDARRLKEINRRISRAGGEIGEITVSLVWRSFNDVDLHVVTPNDEEIFYQHTTGANGGALDVDKNVQPETRRPVENIRWLQDAPAGRYRVLVVLFSTHEAIGADEFLVRVKGGDDQRLFHGQVSPGNQQVHVVDFFWNGTKMTLSPGQQPRKTLFSDVPPTKTPAEDEPAKRNSSDKSSSPDPAPKSSK